MQGRPSSDDFDAPDIPLVWKADAVPSTPAPSALPAAPPPALPLPPPPAPAPPPPGPPPQAPPARWRSLRGLRRALTCLFVAVTLLYVAHVAVLANRLDVIDDYLHGATGAGIVERMDEADEAIEGVRSILVLLLVVVGVCFVTWMWRVAKNNEALARQHPRFGAGWSIGSWFVIVANAVLPLLVMQELWRGADPAVPRGHPHWRKAAKGSVLVGAWWFVYVAGVVAFVVGNDVDDEGLAQVRSVAEVRSDDRRLLVASLLLMTASVLAMLVVRRLSRRQEECLLAQHGAWDAVPMSGRGPLANRGGDQVTAGR